MADLRTRFAPSPTGPLHLGHAFSALTAFDLAQAAGGTFLLRIEDIDGARCRPEWEAQIYEDLHWLGLTWPAPVMCQSDRLPAYRAALDRLAALGVLYPCRCTRGDLRAALSAPQEGVPRAGPDGPLYPGTCRHRTWAEAGPHRVGWLFLSRRLCLNCLMSKTPRFDAALDTIFETLVPHERVCRSCSVTFQIEEGDIEFLKKLRVPPPTLCPRCRLQRRLSYRANMKPVFYKKPCAAAGHIPWSRTGRSG